MNEQTFFMIDGKALILEKVLVEFNEAPIFFVCKFEKTYFISSCVDMEKERYIVAKVVLSNLSKMLHGKITMRNLILQAPLFWDITIGVDVSEDIVIEKKMESILLDELPYEGAYLTLATKDLKEYVEHIDSILYGEGVWKSQISQTYDEYIDVVVNTISEQCEIAIQNICQSIIIKNCWKNFSSCDNTVGLYSKEVSNNNLVVSAKGTNLKVKIKDNDKRSWAA